MCKFCDSLAERKERGSWHGYSDPELGRWMQEYTVALVIHSWYQKRGKNRHLGRLILEIKVWDTD